MSVSLRLALITISAVFPIVLPASAFTPTNSVWRRANVPSQGFFSPQDNNGSMLTSVLDTTPPGLKEPINMIISANSDPAVLKDQQSSGGLRNYYLSVQFAEECLGQHLGNHQMADLGDGHGALNETAVIRYDFNDPGLGTCKESVEGGNHFRYWIQNGPSEDTHAIFMAASYELPASQNHEIIPNGYNLGRDYLVGNITGSTIPTADLTNTSTFSGTTSFGGFTYQTSINYVGGLLENTSIGINHADTVGGGPNNITAIDGLVAVLTVKISSKPSNASSAATRSYNLLPWWTLATLSAFLPF